jgi:vacuolar-type H+-ATPase subunit I/STV1
MFGDMGHGLLMLLFALFMLVKEKSIGKVRLSRFVSYCRMHSQHMRSWKREAMGQDLILK